MSEAITLATIAALTSLILGIINWRIALDTRIQVKNSHGTNMRDDMDKIHKEVIETKESVDGVVKYLLVLDERLWGIEYSVAKIDKLDSHTKSIGHQLGEINSRIDNIDLENVEGRKRHHTDVRVLRELIKEVENGRN